jgi:CPA1 family monovalent cation:H+ antiporter
MLDIAVVLLAIGALLVVVGVTQPVAIWLRLPPAVLLAAIGVAIGGASAVLSHAELGGWASEIGQLFRNFPINAEAFIYVFLPLLVFEAGLTIDVRRMLQDAAVILLLAIVATIVTNAMIGLALWPLAPVSLVACLLLGAVVSTTDPAAVITIFKDVGAPARLTRLVEGESLLNDAAAIALFAVLLEMLLARGAPAIGGGLIKFLISFVGGAAFGVLAGRMMLAVVPWLRGERLSEATMTLALPYLVFIAAERWLHVSGVVAVLVSALTLSAAGRSRITPHNWSFLLDLWEQMAFWARSLVFVLASILVPKLLTNVGPYDLALVAVLVVTAHLARVLVLFVLLPPLRALRLTEPVSTPYKLAIVWGGLRGALTLALALAVTENPDIGPDVKRFVAVLATGLVLFTLLVNGTTLRPVIRFLGLDRLSPLNQALRDHVLALSRADVGDTLRAIARDHSLAPAALERVVEPYEASIATAAAMDAARPLLTNRNRLAVGLVALANQERALVLSALAERTASQTAVQVLLNNAALLIEAANGGGRLAYQRAARKMLEFSVEFRVAYFLYRYFGIERLLADRLADRFEMLITMRLVLERLLRFSDERLRRMFGDRIAELLHGMLRARLDATVTALDALRRQYPDYAAALETILLRQSAVREEEARYQTLFDEGLIGRELYDHLRRALAGRRRIEQRPRLDLGLDPRRLMSRLDLLASLDGQQLDRLRRLLRARFAVPGERIVRKGERGDAVYFIASGAVEVVLEHRRVPLGTNDFFGELALLTGRVRQADIVALSYCQLLVLRKTEFDRFLKENPSVRDEINRVAEARLAANLDATEHTASSAAGE